MSPFIAVVLAPLAALSIGLLGGAAPSVAATGADPPADVRSVPQVDLRRYAGTWWEIARLPNRFQKQCASDVTATYTLREDGGIDVLNRCRREDGSIDSAEGVAVVRASSGARLGVSFLPAWLRWLPVGWSDYWIIELSPDYGHAVVGDPSRRYLWVLSRTPTLDAATLNGLLARAHAMGFPIEQVQPTVNDARRPPVDRPTSSRPRSPTPTLADAAGRRDARCRVDAPGAVPGRESLCLTALLKDPP